MFFSGADVYPAHTGLADELKLFTFASGGFRASQLDHAAAIREPASIAALASRTAAAASSGSCARSLV